MVATTKPRSTPALDTARLEAILDSQRDLGTDAYPMTVRRLLELAHQPEQAAAAFRSVRGSRIVMTAKANATSAEVLEALVFLTGDTDTVVASDPVLLRVLQGRRTAATDLFTISNLSGHLPTKLQSSFKSQVSRRLESARLPAGVGWLRLRGHPYLFLLESVQQAQQRGQAGAAQEFAAQFDAAFERLDRARGNRNQVTLHELRCSLSSFSRDEFDALLNWLRRERRFTLDSSDGRQATLTAEERAAGIREGGNLLIYAART